MDLLEYVAAQMKKGKKPDEIREALLQSGYPVYEVENVLAQSDQKVGEKKKGLSINLSLPSHMVFFILAGLLAVVALVLLGIYFI